MKSSSGRFSISIYLLGCAIKYLVKISKHQRMSVFFGDYHTARSPRRLCNFRMRLCVEQKLLHKIHVKLTYFSVCSLHCCHLLLKILLFQK